MSSKLKLSTIQNQDASKEIETETVIAGSAKAWVLFTGANVHDSFNVLSVTDNGVGDFTANFINNMPSVSFAAVAMPSNAGGTNPYFACEHTSGKTTSTVRVQVMASTTGALTDTDRVSISVFSN